MRRGTMRGVYSAGMSVRFSIAALLLLATFSAAGQLVPAAPTSNDVILLEVLVGCSPSGYDYVVTRSGSVITVTQVPDGSGDGCRPVVTNDIVTIGRLEPGSYTLNYVSAVNAGPFTSFTISFAVAAADVPAAGDFALGALAAILAAGGALLLRRA